MRGWWREVAGLVLPVSCGGCGRPRTALCPSCEDELTGAGAGPRRVRPSPEPPGLPEVYAAAPYEGGVRALLLAHKERGALPLAKPLGVALAGAVTAAAGGLDAIRGGALLLVPVPSSRCSVRARGHDPTRRIALAAAGRLRRTGRTARVLPVLRQRRSVADQSGLGARERLANLAGALEMTAGGRRLLGEAVRAGGRVVLVDDLMTTGASLAEAARAVTAEGRTEASGAGAGHRPFTFTGFTGAPKGAVTEGLFEQPTAAVIASSPSSFEINRNSPGSCIVAGGER
ncbi:ComF family protein [Streptomyces roseicoloratus]|uniref:ComF family protein n=1 Tax=Streptomyces roseicoloratus TaxID=2508722 RepID=A0ABY9RZX4_9ACTN|nr:ComF family protein [Streptomyces roseicoloratus]WMX46739.1 ComF family protein [Streptomyces roseicoloratus]